MWLMKYQHMDEQSFVPFSQFFKVQKQVINKRSAEEILSEAQEIRKSIRKKSGE
jgi:homoserine trans-succinylase